jgi:hypothetical protein
MGVNNQWRKVMGLDMYMTGRKYVGGHWQCDEPIRREDDHPIESIEVSLGYWRKHRKLHGFIVNTFAEGVDECQTIEMSVDALREIATALRTNDLPCTEGFFFGDDAIDAEEKTNCEEYAQQMEDAIKWLEEGAWERSVYYKASW